MISKVLRWTFLLASGGLLVVALSPKMQRWLDQHGFIPNQYIYGDLYNLTNLPGFVVLTSHGKGGQNQPIAARQWSAGFLPSRFQGVHSWGVQRLRVYKQFMF